MTTCVRCLFFVLSLYGISPTWGLAVVAEAGHEEGLRVDDDDGLGVDAVDAAQASQLLGPRVVEVARDLHVAEVHLWMKKWEGGDYFAVYWKVLLLFWK